MMDSQALMGLKAS